MLELDLDIKTTPVKIGKGADKADYTVKEMNQAQKDSYIDTIEPLVRRDAAGKASGITKQSGIYSALLSRCLVDANDKLVPEATIQSWPVAVVAALHKEAQKLNLLGAVEPEKTESETAKNAVATQS